MSSPLSKKDFEADLAEIDKRSGRMPHYRADGPKDKSGNPLERELVPPPAGSSVSTGSRKKPRIDDDSRSPQTGSRPSFPSNPSASRNPSQRSRGITNTARQRSKRNQGLQGSGISTGESSHGDKYSYTPSTAYRPENWGEVRSSRGPPSDDYITEPAGSPRGSDRGCEDTGTDADPPKADQQEMNRLFTALAVSELDDFKYPTELEF